MEVSFLFKNEICDSHYFSIKGVCKHYRKNIVLTTTNHFLLLRIVMLVIFFYFLSLRVHHKIRFDRFYFSVMVNRNNAAIVS